MARTKKQVKVKEPVRLRFNIMNKCDKSENQLFDSMICFIKNGVLLVRDPHLVAKVAIIPKKWKSFVVLKCF